MVNQIFKPFHTMCFLYFLTRKVINFSAIFELWISKYLVVIELSCVDCQVLLWYKSETYGSV